MPKNFFQLYKFTNSVKILLTHINDFYDLKPDILVKAEDKKLQFMITKKSIMPIQK